MPPTISVICPIFNAAHYLEETLDSVFAQDFDDFEVLLVDDGSTDGSDSIAQRYVDRYPGKAAYLTHPGGVNKGVSASRNLGVREAQGNFCAFIDSDDRWRPSKLREQVALFALDPRIDLVTGNANYWRSWRGESDRVVLSGHVQNRLIKPPEASLNVYPLGIASAPCPSDLLIRTSAFHAAGGFDASFVGPLSLYEDQAFLSKVYLHANVWFDRRVWIDYRLHADSMMHELKRSGHSRQVRKYFLEWFGRYLATTRPRHAWRVNLSRQRAYLRFRARWLSRAMDRAERIRRRLKFVRPR